MPKKVVQINANEKHERFAPRVQVIEKGLKEIIQEFDRMVTYHKSLGSAESAFTKALMKVSFRSLLTICYMFLAKLFELLRYFGSD